MKTVASASLVAAALALGHLPLAAAGDAKLRHLVSVYFDGGGVGLNQPEAVACGSNGQFIVGDTGNNRLIRFTYGDRAVTGGTEIKVPQLSTPSRIHLGSNGEIYALDGKQRRIVQLNGDGTFKKVLRFEDAPPPVSVIPKDFAVGAGDILYVLDVFSARVLVVNNEGQFQKALPFPKGISFGSYLAVDAGGNVLLLDAISRRLFSAEKNADTFAALGGDLAEFLPTLPTSMTASKGVVFVVEGNAGSLVGFGRDGSFLTRQLTAGWTEGALNYPAQMCVNDKDEVFIADRDNSRVQVFQLAR